MKTTETRSKNVKIRLTPEEKKAIDNLAEKEGTSFSGIVRRTLFDKESSSSYSIAIQRNLIKNEIMNRIQSMGIPKTTKTKIIKEIGTIE